MSATLINHLWQSTLFALTAGLLTLAFRKNRAAIRYWVWFCASVKFAIPFSLLMALGSYVSSAPEVQRIATRIPVPATLVQLSAPFPSGPAVDVRQSPTPEPFPFGLAAIIVAWVAGSIAIAWSRWRNWRQVRATLRASFPLSLPKLSIPDSVRLRSSPGLLEPGIVGWWRSTLLLPADITNHLTERQLAAVLAHELCHVRRRDNLLSVIHMLVETIFWFHPLVWWIGARLLAEREQACDEEVLRLGCEPEAYAEGILGVCRIYLESPLRCVSGVTGSDIKKRICTILSGSVASELNQTRKALLVFSGVVAFAFPIFAGVAGTAFSPLVYPTPQQQLAFEVASIKPVILANEYFMQGMLSAGAGCRRTLFVTGNRVSLSPITLCALIQAAYNVHDYQILNRPEWVTGSTLSDWYEVEAKSEGGGPLTEERAREMLKTLLAERFQLKIHSEKREIPVYALVVDKQGPKLGVPEKGLCAERGRGGYIAGQRVSADCGGKTSMEELARNLSLIADRPVIDKTGLAGLYGYELQWTPEGAPVEPGGYPLLSTAVQDQLGLRLDRQNHDFEVLVIDQVKRPTPN